MLTNVDILNPESYFAIHMPLFSLLDIQVAMSPGIKQTTQNPKITGDETQLQKDISQPKINEMEKYKVERLKVASKKTAGPYLPHSHNRGTCLQKNIITIPGTKLIIQRI